MSITHLLLAFCLHFSSSLIAFLHLSREFENVIFFPMLTTSSSLVNSCHFYSTSGITAIRKWQEKGLKGCGGIVIEHFVFFFVTIKTKGVGAR